VIDPAMLRSALDLRFKDRVRAMAATVIERATA
jgi:hypothetical protein